MAGTRAHVAWRPPMRRMEAVASRDNPGRYCEASLVRPCGSRPQLSLVLGRPRNGSMSHWEAGGMARSSAGGRRAAEGGSAEGGEWAWRGARNEQYHRGEGARPWTGGQARHNKASRASVGQHVKASDIDRDGWSFLGVLAGGVAQVAPSRICRVLVAGPSFGTPPENPLSWRWPQCDEKVPNRRSVA